MNKLISKLKDDCKDFISALLYERDPQKAVAFFADDAVTIGPITNSMGDTADFRLEYLCGNLSATPTPEQITWLSCDIARLDVTHFAISGSVRIIGTRNNHSEKTDLYLSALLVTDEYSGFKITVFHASVPGNSLFDDDKNLTYLDEAAQWAGVGTETIARCISGGIAVLRLDNDFSLIYGSPDFYKLFGYSENQMRSELGNRLIAIFHHDDINSFSALATEAQGKPEPRFQFVFRAYHRSGELRYYRITGMLVSAEGELRICGIIDDINEQKQLENLVKMKQESLEIALELTGNRSLEFDIKTGRVTYSYKLYQDNISDTVSWTPHEMVQLGIVHADFADSFIDMFERICLGVPRTFCITRLRDNENRYRWNRVTMRTVFREDGDPILAIGVVEDITVQREAEISYSKGLQALRAGHSTAFCSFEANLTENRVERVSSFFTSFENHADSKYSDFCEEFITRCVHPSDISSIRAATSIFALEQSFTTGKASSSFEYRHRMPDDNLFWAIMNINILRDPVTGKLCALVSCEDSERKEITDLRSVYMEKWDPSTGMLSQLAADNFIRERLAASSGTLSGFMIIELDSTNSSRQSDISKNILANVSEALRDCFHFSDVVGYCKNGRFIAYVQHAGTIAQLTELTRHITEVLAQAAGVHSGTTIAVGAAPCGMTGERLHQVYRLAFKAMRAAKKPIGYTVFSDDDGSISEDNADIQRVHSGAGFLPEGSSPSIASTVLQSVLAAGGDPIYISDLHSHELIYVNHAMAVLSGIDEDNYIGKKCYREIYNLDAPCSFCTNSKLRGDDFYTWQHDNLSAGRKYWLRDKLIIVDGKQARIEFALDITEYMLSVDTDYSPSSQQIIPPFVSYMSIASTTSDVINIALEQVAKFYGAERAYLTDINLDLLEFNTKQEWCAPGVSGQVFDWQHQPLEGCSTWVNAVLTRADIYVGDVEDLFASSPLEYRIFKSNKIRSAFAHPYDGSKVGILSYIGVNNMSSNADNRYFLSYVSHFLQQELEKRDLQAKLLLCSCSDSLTGLPSHEAYSHRISELSTAEPASLGVLIADIDGMKIINDQLGYIGGDNLIKAVANAMIKSFGRDNVFRSNSDEFAALFANSSEEEFEQRVNACISTFGGFENVTVSCGSTWSDLDTHPISLIKHADDLMISAKQRFYTTTGGNERHRRPQELKKLLELIKDGSFQMYLQPQVDTRSGEITSAEALVRMYNDGKIVPPALFIEPLEKARLIRYLDLFMFEEACKTISRWQKTGKKLIPLAVNFSRLTLMEIDLITSLGAIIEKHGTPRNMLKVEITETIGEMEQKILSDIGMKLNGAGFGICLDDFGTRYTNLSMLSVIHFEVLKLDRSLVNNLSSNDTSRTVASCVIDMCQRMGVQTIAEGVETEAQQLLLEKMGCHMAQGYLYSRPLPLYEFEKRYGYSRK